jgi:hypothetical protein
MIDFDAIDAWAPSLDLALQDCISPAALEAIRQSQPQFVEDACDRLVALAPRALIVERTLTWIRSDTLAAFHGTRLTPEEADAVKRSGLLPLDATARRARLIRALSPHPRWREVQGQLEAALRLFGIGGAAGSRQGQVHLTLSRAALVDGFNHYLKYGAEFDQHVAHHLLGADGETMLAQDGLPMIVQVEVPGDMAVEGAHSHFGVEEMQHRGELPNIVRDFLQAWAFRQVDAGFQCSGLRVDCGLSFRQALAPQYIRSIQPWLPAPQNR